MGVSYTRDSIPLCEQYLSRYGRPARTSVVVAQKKGILSRLFG
jgi:hypothetical protein